MIWDMEEEGEAEVAEEEAMRKKWSKVPLELQVNA